MVKKNRKLELEMRHSKTPRNKDFGRRVGPTEY